MVTRMKRIPKVLSLQREMIGFFKLVFIDLFIRMFDLHKINRKMTSCLSGTEIRSTCLNSSHGSTFNQQVAISYNKTTFSSKIEREIIPRPCNWYYPCKRFKSCSSSWKNRWVLFVLEQKQKFPSGWNSCLWVSLVEIQLYACTSSSNHTAVFPEVGAVCSSKCLALASSAPPDFVFELHRRKDRLENRPFFG